MLIYAAVYYGFPALLPDLLHDTGRSKSALAFGPSLSFLIMAGLTPFTGRLVDRGYGGEMLIYLPLLVAAGFAVLAFATTQMGWIFGWSLIGVGQAGCLYETCFAFLTRRLGVGARAAITRVTLVAGFAGTLAFPLGHILASQSSGQHAMLAFALMIAGGVVPLNAVAVWQLRRGVRLGGARYLPEPGALAAAVRRPAFWFLVAVFGTVMLGHGILLTYILVLFADRGAGVQLAMFAAACIGPAQVAGRLLLLFGEARVGNLRALVLGQMAIVFASVTLWMAGAAPGLILVVAIAQGAGIGVFSILRPVLIGDILGKSGFGTVSGVVAMAPILATAAAPLLGAQLFNWGGVAVIYLVCIGLSIIGLSLGVALTRLPAQRHKLA